jgi:hypothetical protein
MSHEAFLKFLASASLHATLEHAWHARDAEVADLQRQLDNERARGIHSCHANCSRDGCVNRRLRALLESTYRWLGDDGVAASFQSLGQYRRAAMLQLENGPPFTGDEPA